MNDKTPEIYQFAEPVQIMLKEMCRRVGADPEKLNFVSDEYWFNKYEWTVDDYNSFGWWLLNYLKYETGGRLMNFSWMRRSKKWRIKVAKKIMSNYTWKFKKPIDYEKIKF